MPAKLPEAITRATEALRIVVLNITALRWAVPGPPRHQPARALAAKRAAMPMAALTPKMVRVWYSVAKTRMQTARSRILLIIFNGVRVFPATVGARPLIARPALRGRNYPTRMVLEIWT